MISNDSEYQISNISEMPDFKTIARDENVQSDWTNICFISNNYFL